MRARANIRRNREPDRGSTYGDPTSALPPKSLWRRISIDILAQDISTLKRFSIKHYSRKRRPAELFLSRLRAWARSPSPTSLEGLYYVTFRQRNCQTVPPTKQFRQILVAQVRMGQIGMGGARGAIGAATMGPEATEDRKSPENRKCPWVTEGIFQTGLVDGDYDT